MQSSAFLILNLQAGQVGFCVKLVILIFYIADIWAVNLTYIRRSEEVFGPIMLSMSEICLVL